MKALTTEYVKQSQLQRKQQELAFAAAQDPKTASKQTQADKETQKLIDGSKAQIEKLTHKCVAAHDALKEAITKAKFEQEHPAAKIALEGWRKNSWKSYRNSLFSVKYNIF